jgi:ABC-type branched-subunit amino acid transport system ATPase component
VRIEETDCTGWSPHKIARIGVSRSFQNVRLFPNLTAQENVEVGVASAIGWGRVKGNRAVIARELLREVGVGGLEKRAAATLPHGTQRKIEIARALATQAKYLFFDEPAAGLNESESDELLELISTLRRERGCGLLVVDHDLRLIMRLCDSVQVLHEGSTLAVGSPADVRSNQAVIDAYLGRSDVQAGTGSTEYGPET